MLRDSRKEAVVVCERGQRRHAIRELGHVGRCLEESAHSVARRGPAFPSLPVLVRALVIAVFFRRVPGCTKRVGSASRHEFKRRQVMTMESLNERLTAFRIKGESSRDPEVTALMHRATDDLRASGILAGVPSVGDAAPLFVRPDLDGATVHLRTLLERGPTIVSFFRGRW